ncbi:hypothetical protein [Pelagibius sp.]|uniref:hypothetical protein n=1 Tax=Pelagibius sp. TaxID=1931238 RepID=UPI00262A707F|nr:hypothetical protein [Pelagibius sp.]
MLDLYAGPLERYYTRRWETAAAVASRELGMPYELVFEGGMDPLSLSDDDARSAVRDFASRLAPKLHLEPHPSWEESFTGPYETIQLTQDGFAALVLWTAYLHREDLERPQKLPQDPWSDPAISEASERGYYMGPMAIFEAHMTVPGREPRITSEDDPIGRSLVVTTTAALEEAIGLVSESLSLAPDQALEIVRLGPPATGKILAREDGGRLSSSKEPWAMEKAPPVEDAVKAWAEYAVSALVTLSAFSKIHSVPIVRDE